LTERTRRIIALRTRGETLSIPILPGGLGRERIS
jgi:hypothetical protein